MMRLHAFLGAFMSLASGDEYYWLYHIWGGRTRLVVIVYVYRVVIGDVVLATVYTFFLLFFVSLK